MKSLFVLIFCLPILLFCDKREPFFNAIEEFRGKHDGVSVAAVVISQGKLDSFDDELFFQGSLSKESYIDYNSFTELRIGFLTKAFTATLLAQYVLDGKVDLNSPVKPYLPRSFSIPVFDVMNITAKDLASHMSGLPDMPLKATSRTGFKIDEMKRFLKGYKLKRDPGSKYQYSNLGYALLSDVLTRVGRKSLPELLKKKVFDPLELNDTRFALTREQKKRVATGYRFNLPISPLKRDKLSSVFLGANGLYSTAEDMLRFLKFNLGGLDTPLNQLLPILHKPYFELPNGEKMALGFLITDENIWTMKTNIFGFSGYLAFNREEGRGVFVIANRQDIPTDKLGFNLFKMLPVKEKPKKEAPQKTPLPPKKPVPPAKTPPVQVPTPDMPKPETQDKIKPVPEEVKKPKRKKKKPSEDPFNIDELLN